MSTQHKNQNCLSCKKCPENRNSFNPFQLEPIEKMLGPHVIRITIAYFGKLAVNVYELEQ